MFTRAASCVSLAILLSGLAGWNAPPLRADVLLSDIVAGGDGSGNAPPEYCGINPDTGLFEEWASCRTTHAIFNSGDNPQEIPDDISPFIDSVFIIEQVPMPINSSGAVFDFAPGDANTARNTWDHILKDRTTDIDKGYEDVYTNFQVYPTGVGMAGSAGITFDLEAIRGVHGPENVEYFTAVVGQDRCNGLINNYVVLSDDENIFEGFYQGQFRVAQGEPMQLLVPPEAKFLTLTTGTVNGDLSCDHGVFAEARLSQAPPVLVQRTIPDAFLPGELITNDLAVTVLSPTNVLEVREVIPRGFTAASPSAGGVIENGSPSPGRQTVVWRFTGGVVDQGLSYEISVPSPYPNSSFRASTAIADGVTVPIVGDSGFKGGTDGFQSEALYITLRQPTTGCRGQNPGLTAIRQDYLTDGDAISELTVIPTVGESVSPDFLGASPSPGPMSATSTAWTRITGQGWFQLNTGDPATNEVMSYVAFYVNLPEAMRLAIGSASDDSQQILVDGKEVWAHAIGRGSGAAVAQDHSPLFDLGPGKHLVMQKVFEGCGGFDCAMRFEDEDQNPLLLSTSLDPSGYQAFSAFVMREIPASLDTGETGTIRLRLRVKEPTVGLVLEENVPAAFSITAVGPEGVRNGQKITWTIAGPLSNRDFTYTVSIPEGAVDAPFLGTAVVGGTSTDILGDRGFRRGAMTTSGFIKQWLVFGPLDTFGLWQGDLLDPNTSPEGASATPENGELRADFLANDRFTEDTIRPFDGMRHLPDFEGLAKARGFEALVGDCAPATPTWEAYLAPSDTLDNDTYFGQAVDSHTTYAACYVTNTTAQDIAVTMAINSDDAFIAFLDGNEVVAYEPGPCSATACGRGYGADESTIETGQVTLTPGEHFLLTRVHDGYGGSGHRLRLQDAAGNPLLPAAIKVSLKPSASRPPVYVRRILSSESYRPPEAPAVTLRVESQGNHQVDLREVLPAGWSATGISHGGSETGGVVTWSVAVTAGTTDVTYRLAAGECPAGGSYCGNGPEGSTYTVDGTDTHSLNGDRSFRRDTKGTDDLGAWQVTDIASTGGATQRAGDRGVDVTGKGSGIRSTRDEFRFVSVTRSGDFEISARIDCMDDPSGTGRGGLMVRDTFDNFSAHAFFALGLNAPGAASLGTLSGVTRLETKKNKISSQITISDKDVPALPMYLKLKRAGTKLTLSRSADGKSYADVGSRDIGTGVNQLQLRTETLVGLAVTGGARVDFREVSGVPELPAFTPVRPDKPTLTQATGGTEQVALTWTAPATGPTPSGYVIRRAEAIGGPYSTVTDGAMGTSYTDTGLLAHKEYCYVVRSKLGTLESDDSNAMCARTAGNGVTFRRGNVNGDALLDISDAIGILGYLFLGQADKVVCVDAADIKDKGAIDISDAISVLNFLFQGGTAPAAPGPNNCGPDVIAESPDLGCVQGC